MILDKGLMARGLLPRGLLPHAVQHVTIWEHSQHDVVSGGVVRKRPFGVNKEDVRNPDLPHEPAVEGHALVGGAGKGQPLVPPVMPQVQGHGEVLGARKKPRKGSESSQKGSESIPACD